MPVQQVLADALDPAAIRAMGVPDVWPPPDCSATAWVHDRQPDTGSDPAAGQAGTGQPWPQRFAVLLTESLAGVRPASQLRPWLSVRGNVQLRRLQPLFRDGHRPRVQRVLTTRPAPGVIEMTVIVAIGPRTRAVAVRLERTGKAPDPHARHDADSHRPGNREEGNWLCTAIEAA